VVFAGLHHLGQIVHGVKIDVFKRLHLQLNVTRHGQINHEHGPVLALLEGALHRAQADDGQGAGSAADDGVKLVQALWQVAQAHDFRAKAAGQFFATLQRAVGNRHRLGVLGCKVGGGQLDHFTGADKQHADVAQVFKQLACQSHRGRCHADAVGADFGVAAHVLGDCK